MTTVLPSVADWVPRALTAQPDDEFAPRLLEALLRAVDTQRAELAADIDSVWDDFFIDSCADWAVPYVAALIGLPADAERAEVAYAIALRRRKGTRAALDEFAEILTGWNARVIEGWQATIWAQRPDHPRPRPAAVDLRQRGRYRIGTAFEDARRSFTPSRQWSPRAVTALLWPWRVRTYERTQAAPLAGTGRFALHPLGAEAPLYLRPRPLLSSADFGSPGVVELAGDERDAPVRATYRLIEALAGPGDLTYGARWTLGANHPLVDVSTPGRPALLRLTVTPQGAAETTVNWSDLRLGPVPAAPAPAPNEVVLDVSRGRVEFGTPPAATSVVRATWHRPVAGELGALGATPEPERATEIVAIVDPTERLQGSFKTLTLAFQYARAQEALYAGTNAAVEIRLLTSDRLEPPEAQPPGAGLTRWRIVAPLLHTPTIAGDLTLDLEGRCVALEGFQIDGDLVVGKKLGGARLRNVTIDPDHSVIVEEQAWGVELKIERSIVGPIRAELAAVPVTIVDSIVDGRRAHARPCGGSPDAQPTGAVAKRNRFGPHLHANGVTFVGPVRVEVLDAMDSLFVDGVEVVQQQEGCIRHSYLGPELTSPPSYPPTYRCLSTPPPTFASTGFEAAGYYALALEPDHPLLGAASDGGEVGAYHHARRASRLARLRARIHEFVPLGLRANVALAAWEE